MVATETVEAQLNIAVIVPSLLPLKGLGGKPLQQSQTSRLSLRIVGLLERVLDIQSSVSIHIYSDMSTGAIRIWTHSQFDILYGRQRVNVRWLHVMLHSSYRL